METDKTEAEVEITMTSDTLKSILANEMNPFVAWATLGLKVSPTISHFSKLFSFSKLVN